jgi:hypothetical protein
LRRSERAARRQQRRIRAAMVNSQINRADPHSSATGSDTVQG